MWRDRITARKVLALLDMLPRESNYASAIADDEELAFNTPTVSAGSSNPKLTEWGPVEERLTNIQDLLKTLITLQVAQQSKKKPKPPKPSPRPVTAWQRAAQQKRYEQHRQLVSRVLPHKQG